MTHPIQYSGELVAELHSLTTRAKEQAAANRPPSDATRPDQNEVEVITSGEELISRAHGSFTSALADASRRAHDLQQEIPALEGRIAQALSDTSLQAEADAVLAGEKSRLARFAESRMRALTDLKYFRDKHGIESDADYPESHILHMGIIAILVLIETAVNAFFYENAQGLLGGFFVALGVSGFNMGTAFVLGVLFRFKHLRDPEKRLAGWLCLVAFVAIAIYCNSLFAAFRAEYQLIADPTAPALLRQAFRRAASQAAHVFTLRMDFGDFLSFILFGLGVLLSLFAFYKGYTYDDRYPGHGKLDRKYRRARADEEMVVEAIREKLKDFLMVRRREVEELPKTATRIIQDASAHAARLQGAWAQYHTQQDLIAQDCRLALEAYRNANAAIRPTPAPRYFSDFPNISREMDEGVRDGVLALLGSAHSSGIQLRDRHLPSLTTRLNNLQAEIAIILDRRLSDFVRQVEAEAVERIDRFTGTVQRSSRETAVRV